MSLEGGSGIEPQQGWDPVRDRAGAGASCAYCRQLLPWAGALACRRCGVIYHPDCWKANHSRCAVYGCEPAAAPAPARAEAPRGRAPARGSGWRLSRYAWPLMAIALFLGRHLFRSEPSHRPPAPIAAPVIERPSWMDFERARRGVAPPGTSVRGSEHEGAARTEPAPVTAADYHARSLDRVAAGAWGEALADENRALELDPGPGEFWRGRAAIRMHLGDYAGAIADCDRAVRLEPAGSDALELRAAAREGRGDWRGAEEDLSRAVGLAPTSQGYVLRGRVRVELGKTGPALEDFARALELDPGEPRAYHSRGHLRETLGDREGAFADFSRAAGLDPLQAELHDDLGRVRRERGEEAQALREYTRALELDPQSGPGYFHRGLLRYDLGSWAGRSTISARPCGSEGPTVPPRSSASG